MPLLAQQSQRLAAGIQCHVDDLGTFGNENTLVWLDAVAELGLGKRAEHFYTRLCEGCDVDNRHCRCIGVMAAKIMKSFQTGLFSAIHKE